MIDKLLIFFGYILFLVSNLEAGPKKNSEIILENIKYFDFIKNKFSETSDILISNGKIISISPGPADSQVAYYILPGFCDTSVNLGFNSIGGIMDRESGKLALGSFLAHGFTHINSMNPSPWIDSLQKDIISGKFRSPVIQYSGKILVTETKEYPELPKNLYFVGKNREDIFNEVHSQLSKGQKQIQIYHRYYPGNDFFFDSVLIHDIDSIVRNSGGKLEVTTFTDRVALYDAVRAGVFRIKDPIFYEDFSSLPSEIRTSLEWTPALYLYKSLGFANLEEKEKHFSKLSELSLYFKLYYRETASTYSSGEITEAELKGNKNFKNYISIIKNYSDAIQRIYLGSGSGHFLVFPGISGLEEYRMYYELTNDPVGALRTMTVNACKIFEDYSGKVAVGELANLVLYKSNPLENSESIYKIHEVFSSGYRIEVTKQEETKGKKNKK